MVCLGCEEASPRDKVLRWEGVVGMSLSPISPCGEWVLPLMASGFLARGDGTGRSGQPVPSQHRAAPLHISHVLWAPTGFSWVRPRLWGKMKAPLEAWLVTPQHASLLKLSPLTSS